MLNPSLLFWAVSSAGDVVVSMTTTAHSCTTTAVKQRFLKKCRMYLGRHYGPFCDPSALLVKI